MRRREFIAIAGSVAAAWPFAVQAQPADRVRLVGVLIAFVRQTDREGQERLAAMLGTLQELGWTEGRNIRTEVRWASDNIESIKRAAADLVGLAPDVILTATNPALIELKELTRTIPIVFTQVSDPVQSGFVASLARPGGNITGFQNFEGSMGGKWLGLLKEAVPNLKRVAVIYHPLSSANTAMFRAAVAVGPSLSIEVASAGGHDIAEVGRAIAAFAGRPDTGLIVVPHNITTANRDAIIALAARHRLPAIYPFRYFAAEGGLMSYGIDQVGQWRAAAGYVNRILRGERPEGLPVQAPTKFDLVINLKIAKAMGFDISPTLPLRADEVIE
jgi:putative tryptophan/tyrosine transport system substrate-binding protein